MTREDFGHAGMVRGAGSNRQYFAHSANQRGQRHDLIEHLRGVAERAMEFAADFNAGDAAYFLGLCHDIGKLDPAFQEYLLECERETGHRRKGPDHKAAGALLAAERVGLGALAVQGHHGGLGTLSQLKTWLAAGRGHTGVEEALRRVRLVAPEIERLVGVALPEYVLSDPLVAELFVRMLFSALVDADFLDTERHFAPSEAERRVADAAVGDLWSRLAEDQRRFTGQRGVVAEARREVYARCIEAAELPQGIFRLTVPTGGGKTRSALAFALRHAMRHSLRRVVVAVPFISITEQTADVYRDIFERHRDDGAVVVEHHSGLTRRGEEDDFDARSVWARLASENWDAPIVVTTTVQLFESLFARETSRARKIHRLAKSVVILDEAQALPPRLLTPMLDVVRELTRHYGTTVVISTATQPAFEAIPIFASVPAAVEIVPDHARLFAALRRVEYQWPEAPLEWLDVAERMREAAQVLAIVNAKRDAMALLDALGDPEALHLSTLLCGQHRRRVIAEVRQRLAEGLPCRLVSTQVVEAGVDLDFPLVLRALAPLDGIIQAAGRCNREGRLARGRVVVFRAADDHTPRGAYSVGRDVTKALAGGGPIDPDDGQVAREYFRRFFETMETDAEGIQKLRTGFDYPEVARRFRMIDDDTVSLAVTTFGTPEERRSVRRALEELRRRPANGRKLLRELQPYLVSARRREVERYTGQGLVDPIIEGLGEWLGGYDDKVRGLSRGDAQAEALVI